ncbi:Cupredoxin [Armillaria fumosa]|nr:Cupredoxin [Armillaria fumosa]
MFFILFAVLVSAVFVSAADHLVTVGDGGTLAFNPTNVTALEGDTVTFSFRAKNHSATQSTFAAPCNKSGIDSGFVPIPSNSTEFGQWTFTVDNTAPLWFFCAQTGHCEAGMVFAVNTTPEKSFQAFLATAQGNGTASSSTGVSSTAVVSSASAAASATASSSAASSTANVNTASNAAASSPRIHSITFSIVALVFGVLL